MKKQNALINMAQFTISRDFAASRETSSDWSQALREYYFTGKPDRKDSGYHEIQEKTFQVLCKLNEEAVSAGEPSFFCRTVETYDWDSIESILDILVRQLLDNLYRTIFGGSDTAKTEVDFDRVWKKIQAGLKSQN